MISSFSASQLQDFVHCSRLFELRHVLKQSWPIAEDNLQREFQLYREWGNSFHFMVDQYFSRVGVQETLNRDADVKVKRWFEAFLKFKDSFDSITNYAEISLITKLEGSTFRTKMDLISLCKDNIVKIFDWKTYKKRPSDITMASRIQTKLYPFAVFENIDELFPEKNIQPQDVQMIYWYPEAVKSPQLFKYDEQIHAENRRFLNDLVRRIIKKEIFEKTDNKILCQSCPYIVICGRGTFNVFDSNEELGIFKYEDEYTPHQNTDILKADI